MRESRRKTEAGGLRPLLTRRASERAGRPVRVTPVELQQCNNSYCTIQYSEQAAGSTGNRCELYVEKRPHMLAPPPRHG